MKNRGGCGPADRNGRKATRQRQATRPFGLGSASPRTVSVDGQRKSARRGENRGSRAPGQIRAMETGSASRAAELESVLAQSPNPPVRRFSSGGFSTRGYSSASNATASAVRTESFDCARNASLRQRSHATPNASAANTCAFRRNSMRLKFRLNDSVARSG